MAMTHARREQLARERGFGSYRAERAYKATLKAERLAADPQAAAVERERQAARRQLIGEPGERIVRSKREDVIRSQLRQMAKRGAKVELHVRTEDGRVARYYSRGGRTAASMLRDTSAVAAASFADAAGGWITGGGAVAVEGGTGSDIEMDDVDWADVVDFQIVEVG